MLGGLFGLMIYILVVGLFIALCYWAIGAVGLPEPFARFAHIALVIITFIIIGYLLLGLVGGGPPGPIVVRP